MLTLAINGRVVGRVALLLLLRSIENACEAGRHRVRDGHGGIDCSSLADVRSFPKERAIRRRRLLEESGAQLNERSVRCQKGGPVLD
jgi:hypothetical protein